MASIHSRNTSFLDFISYHFLDVLAHSKTQQSHKRTSERRKSGAHPPAYASLDLARRSLPGSAFIMRHIRGLQMKRFSFAI